MARVHRRCFQDWVTSSRASYFKLAAYFSPAEWNCCASLTWNIALAPPFLLLISHSVQWGKFQPAYRPPTLSKQTKELLQWNDLLTDGANTVGDWEATEPTQEKTFTAKDRLISTADLGVSLIATAKPYSSSIQGQKKQKQKQVHLTTQGTSNQRLSPGSVQSKMFTLRVFPLPVPCSWAWRRERQCG